MWVLVDQWDKMTDQERDDVARRQAALLEGQKSAAGRASTRAGQLPLFKQ